jgi:hypothetical protein
MADQKSMDDKIVGYCVKCRKKQTMKDPKEVKMKGKGGPRRAAKGNCPVCGTGMYRILGKA